MMKTNWLEILFVVAFLLFACSPTIIPLGQDEDTVVPVSTLTHTPTPTASDTPSPTLAITPSITPTASITPIPTVTPENFVLADSGNDIADVRISYPLPNTVNINFKYHVDLSKITNNNETILISVLLPVKCSGTPTWELVYHPVWSAGSGQIVYEQAPNSKCKVPFFDMVVLFRKQYDAYNENSVELYRERINQPFEVVNNSPAIDSKTLTIKGFSFETTGPWSGQLRFEYVFSPELADVIGKYKFVLTGSGDILYCDFASAGPVITEIEGTYVIDVDLRKDISKNAGGINCSSKLSQSDSLTYRAITLSLTNNTYHQGIATSITFEKQP
jgi:hypothetical protein